MICKHSLCGMTDVEDMCKTASALSARSQIKQQEGIQVQLCRLKKNKSNAFDFIEYTSSLDRKLNQNIPPQVALPKWFVLRCQLGILCPKHFCQKFYDLQTFFVVIALENEQNFLKVKRKTNPKNRVLFCTVFTPMHFYISRNITIQLNRLLLYTKVYLKAKTLQNFFEKTK